MKSKLRIQAGIYRIVKNRILLLIPIAYIIIVGFVMYKGNNVLSKLNKPFSSYLYKYIFIAIIVDIALIGMLWILTLIGTPFGAKRIEKLLSDAGFTDKLGNSPMLLSRKKINNGIELEFFSKTISLAEYEKQKDKIETALNIKIIAITFGKDMRHVIIKAISASNDKKDIIRWSDTYLSDKDFELVLGESYFGTENIDIAVTPHILIGGGSGSGKSKLLKLMLMQSIKKGAMVYLADFKGGVDYPSIWHKRCDIITEQKQLESQLSIILEEMEKRRELLVKSETSNIGEYKQKTGANLQRIIVACDEIAEVLDKTGLDKSEKELVGKVESKLSTIARQGRAFGIHLILATQRPDADVLKGQIKNNIGYRVCGRADKVLSQIILDNTQGADMISPHDQGLFFTNTGVLFKAFYVVDDCLKGV